MKKALFIIIAMVVALTVSAKNDNTKTTVFKTDITCESCRSRIMNNVPSLGKGIKDVKVDVATKEVTVTYDATKNSDENIVKGLESIKVKAQPAAEAKACCKAEEQPAEAKTCCKAEAKPATEAKACCKAEAQPAEAKTCCETEAQPKAMKATNLKTDKKVKGKAIDEAKLTVEPKKKATK